MIGRLHQGVWVQVGPHMEYLDFELEVRPLGGRQYELVVIKSPAGEARERVTFPLDTLQLNDSLKDVEIALLRSSKVRRQALTEEEQNVQNFGRHLFDFLLPSELRGLYRTSLNRARREDKGLRLKLRLNDPDLTNLPWEFLYDAVQREYLCLAQETPLVRYVELERTLEPRWPWWLPCACWVWFPAPPTCPTNSTLGGRSNGWKRRWPICKRRVWWS